MELGFTAGNCRDTFCHMQPVCRRLMSPEGCRHPGLSSPSLKASSIDALTMASRAGWDVYPIGGTCRPESVPHGTLMGLVLVAGREARVPPAQTDGAAAGPGGKRATNCAVPSKKTW
jgi:hypothetical protein